MIIDDDTLLLELIKQVFCLQGALVYTADSGAKGLQQFYLHCPDLVILDIMMPHINGFEICRLIRESSDVPVIILTALGEKKEIIHGFDCGADDYVTKPFNPDILLVRAQAILHRAALPASPEKVSTYSDGYLKIEPRQGRVFVRGEPVKLSAKEYRLLTYLFQNAGQLLTIDQILDHVWGWEYRNNVDYVHVYIHHLRQKLEENPQQPEYLLTEYGLGYRFEKKLV
ncbi:MAG: response regulator transcription factor [Anaerolineae bacterium]|nr:response regulator transcription factor [Anaerolineae bacterium]